MFGRLRATMQRWFTPLANLLIRRGVSPDAVTIAGTVIVTVLALTLLPTGHLTLGALLIGLFVLTDSLDGVMARASGRSGPWGAFLDSTLDRVSDGAVFAGITLWFALHPQEPWAGAGTVAALACLVLGSVVPYARARAESVGATAAVGIAERSDRLVVALVPTAFVQVGLPVAVLVVVLGLLALASLVTVAQRVLTVRSQLLHTTEGA
ncbi:CDP-diacylglycerol inositol 3-phosphatidyltransferase [Isoptericola sp. CG 20/1183]|uniref:Phosphatidylinositol phosphate synthase n=1 Tax=Isoptericola halotolerans TaxID=300560 RepID=A0ABX5EAS4_9MICO|nr:MULTISPECIES: CDP-alcohol phosphatidyltransferase family protein [Isoptericola]PRZ04364.1 CDP-diacylglycerol inositol 3-phosphatidyltransferase [Isoptericola halotolerans]PRZ04738.1 CDP-diacylglycerol inositol 3-phosphatidyltransferase [Isoptericola sp. CG 20/1183]